MPRCSVEGLFPQQIPAQSVQSSGGDERWGLGGNATTHFTGKSGSRSSDTPPLIQTPVGALFGFYISRRMRPVEEASGRCEERTEAESRICSAFNISSGVPQLAATPATSALSCPAVPASSAGIRGFRTILWHFPDATLEGEGVGGWRSLCFNLTRVRRRAPLCADALVSAEG